MASPPALSRREGAGSRKGFLLFFISLSVLQLPLYGEKFDVDNIGVCAKRGGEAVALKKRMMIGR